MTKTLVIWNLVITGMLVAMIGAKISSNGSVRAAGASGIIRTTRLELVDQGGKTRAILEADKENFSNPKLVEHRV